MVPILYTAASPAKQPSTVQQVYAPAPPYPYQAKAEHFHGSGIVQVTFDKSGKAISAKMTKSTGVGILDDNTVNYALAKWKTFGGKKTTISAPVAYRL